MSACECVKMETDETPVESGAILSPRARHKKKRRIISGVRSPRGEPTLSAPEGGGGSESEVEVAPGSVRSKRRDVPADSAVEMAEISAAMRALMLSEGVTKRVAKEALELAAKYEAVIVRKCTEIARLEGRLEGRRESGVQVHGSSGNVGKTTSGATQPPSTPRSSPTYALVVRSAAQNDAVSAETLRQRVLDVGREVGPVKVKSVRILKDGGVAVVASSRADIVKIRAAPEFAAAGLALADPKMGKPCLLVGDVPADVTNERLIGEVLPHNLKGVGMAAELAECRVVTRMGRTNGSANVVLEMPKKLHACLLNEGRLYIGWNSCRVREYENVLQCYGCGSFGHLLARCTLGRLCHNCGETGHGVGACKGAAKCRNCSLRGLPADHRVTSVRCPCFVREAERRQNRVIG